MELQTAFQPQFLLRSRDGGDLSLSVPRRKFIQSIRAIVSSLTKSLSFQQSSRQKPLSMYPECRCFCPMSLYQYCLHVVRLLIHTCTETMRRNCMYRKPNISRDLPKRVAKRTLQSIVCQLINEVLLHFIL